jgi:hypothetical protein
MIVGAATSWRAIEGMLSHPAVDSHPLAERCPTSRRRAGRVALATSAFKSGLLLYVSSLLGCFPLTELQTPSTLPPGQVQTTIALEHRTY